MKWFGLIDHHITYLNRIQPTRYECEPVGSIDQSMFMRGCVSVEVISRVGYA